MSQPEYAVAVHPEVIEDEAESNIIQQERAPVHDQRESQSSVSLSVRKEDHTILVATIDRTASQTKIINDIPRLDVAASRVEMPQEAGANLPVVLGRVVQSPKYGKGFIAAIEGDTIRIRFWKSGYKTFRKPENAYPFELCDEVRPVDSKSIVEKAVVRETSTEKRQRAFRCPHSHYAPLCLKCAGLSENEARKWNPYRTLQRPIDRSWETLNRYVPVRISRNDCVLISRPEEGVPEAEISNWYECRECGTVTETRATGEEPVKCPVCNGAVFPIGEPFRRSQFAPEKRPKEEDYADASIPARTRHTEEKEIETGILRDLYTDPNSRFQEGGTGYLRIPHDAPRSTRADAPKWLDCRKTFLQTLKDSRSKRAERILCGFYVDGMTDTQIAEAEGGWTRDSVKKERKLLVEQGNGFFALDRKHPPSPAVDEGAPQLEP